MVSVYMCHVCTHYTIHIIHYVYVYMYIILLHPLLPLLSKHDLKMRLELNDRETENPGPRDSSLGVAIFIS